MSKGQITNPYNNGICPVCGKSGLKSVRQHINKAHKKNLTEAEYIKVMGIEDKECVICGRRGHESSYKYDLCPDCLDEWSRECPICGIPLVWHSGVHFSRDHHCEPPEGMDELKLIKCNHCGKVLYPKRIPCGMREREYEAYCDDCLEESFICPSCGQRVFRGTFYTHLKSKPFDCDSRNDNGQSLSDQFVTLMNEANLSDDWIDEEIKAADEYNELVSTNSAYYSEWRTGKTFKEIYGDKADEICQKISRAMVENKTGWSYWKDITPEQKAEVVRKSHETRNKRYGEWTSAKTRESTRKHIQKVNKGFYGGTKRYSNISKIIFDQLDELIPSYTTYHSNNEWPLELSNEESAVLGQQLVMIDYYCPELSLVIEFNGDYWHANPNRYRPNDVVHDDKLASDIWAHDKLREEIVKKKLGIEHYFVLWETDNFETLNEIRELMINANDIQANVG